jgi:hypothetical protein
MDTLSLCSTFAERYALETVEGGGVLVDLTSGSYFSLNATAARACAALYRSSGEAEATATLVVDMSISADEAGRLVRTVTNALGQNGTRNDPIGPFRYHRVSGGYTLDQDGRPSLRIDEQGSGVELIADPSALTFPLLDYVRAVVPKILFLRGTAVLHGAACEVEGALTAFCGISHAGKTTTALAFGTAGARVVAEDLLLVDSASEAVTIFTTGEREAHAWAERTANELARGPGTLVSSQDLVAALSGSTRPVDRIWFLDEKRRAGTAFVTRRLGPAEGLLPLMSATFLGAGDGPSWRRYLGANRRVAEQVAMWEVCAPNGAGALVEAARLALADHAPRS